MTVVALFLAATVALLSAQGQRDCGCALGGIRPGGLAVDSRFFPASPQRTREVLEDAMQAAGVLLFESTPAVVRGERAGPRLRALDLPPGDEALFGHLEPSEKDGIPGTLVRVETRRRGGKNGEPGQKWSVPVLDEAACLLRTLVGTGDVPPRAGGGAASDAGTGQQRETLVPAGTVATLVLRRFVFSGGLRLNQKIQFEVASDVSVGPDVVMRRGALGVARVKATLDSAGSKSAQAQIEFESVYSVSGAPVPVRGAAKFAGKAGKFSTLGWGVGQGFALCAGARFDVTVDGEQRVRVDRE